MIDIIKILLALIIVGLFAYVIITYGNTPIADVPYWVVWVFGGR